MKYKSPIKPIAERISSFSPRREVIYRCGKCNTSFTSLGDKIKFCYNCGIPVNWDVITQLSDDFSYIYATQNDNSKIYDIDEFEEHFISKLNESQLGEQYLKLYDEKGKPLKCDSCIHTIDNEYCDIDDKDKTIIHIPPKNGYCRSAICDKYCSNK